VANAGQQSAPVRRRRSPLHLIVAIGGLLLAASVFLPWAVVPGSGSMNLLTVCSNPYGQGGATPWLVVIVSLVIIGFAFSGRKFAFGTAISLVVLSAVVLTSAFSTISSLGARLGAGGYLALVSGAAIMVASVVGLIRPTDV
jgi:hypothetical protein